ncbi:probable CCR4-associated factor 1 homolog 7 [Ananas comosus]|uniref:poly(A)-specific ribonuclease n=1 Tax=Ananas comosus TaxID=4615 RepID=A0A6P5G9X5_ANACO|nr:probable CCR4-associated factor 1 homolog 7 [Ananas comosus]
MASSIPADGGDGDGDGGGGVEIREVWAENLEAEFAVIRSIVDEYPFIALDTEYPGVAFRVLSCRDSYQWRNYDNLAANVDVLHLIQVGLTFSDALGRLPCLPRPCLWQFNFREFDPEAHPCAPDSIALLRAAGIDFARNRAQGVSAARFAELLMTSGAVLNDSVTWITFHGSSDIAYLLKILKPLSMPETIRGFCILAKIFFPNLYDVKHLMKFCRGPLYGGLKKLAESLGVERIGISHQAGSDSLVTARCFRRLLDLHLKDRAEQYAGILYGLNDDPSVRLY